MQFMSSGPSHILVLSQVEDSANIVPAWREFIGPVDLEEARREKPERLVTGNCSYAPFRMKMSPSAVLRKLQIAFDRGERFDV